MRIHLFAPFFSGSHRRWAEEYAGCSRHDVRLFTLPGHHWKWRMHGAAVELAEQFLAQPEQPDLLLTTDMLDTATFLALTRSRSAGLPVAVYFHENQLTYPWSPTDVDPDLQRDRHYAWLNYTSALVVDALLFNSDYHRHGYLAALPDFLRAFPDYRGLNTIPSITKKSKTLALGLALAHPSENNSSKAEAPPILLWNHRWEYDKNPATFFQICERLQSEELQFQLVVLGESYARTPAVFAQARERLQDRILHWGYAENTEEYRYWLRRADLLPVTSYQDFFGGSIVEAIYHNVYPLLPDRLAYPEHIPPAQRPDHLYTTDKGLYKKLRALLLDPGPLRDFRSCDWVAHYDWSRQGRVYDDFFAGLG